MRSKLFVLGLVLCACTLALGAAETPADPNATLPTVAASVATPADAPATSVEPSTEAGELDLGDLSVLDQAVNRCSGNDCGCHYISQACSAACAPGDWQCQMVCTRQEIDCAIACCGC